MNFPIHKKIISRLCFTALLLIMTFTLLSASGTGNSYRLKELIEIGLERSVGMKTGQLQLENSKSALTTTHLDFLPSASVNMSRNYSTRDEHSAGFSLSKSLSLNEPTYFNWRRTNIDWENARLTYEETRRKTVFEIFTRFVRVAEAQKRVDIQEKNLAIQQRITEQMELLHRLEQRSLIELKQTQISLINSQIALADAQNQLRNTRENLFFYLNIDDEGYPLAEVDLPLNNVYPPFRKTADIIEAENNLRKTGISLTQSKLNFLPNLSLSYSYMNSYRTTLENDLFDFDKYRDSYTVSLSASYSLFNYVEHRQQHHRSRRSEMIQQLMLDNQISNNQKLYDQLVRDLEREKSLYELAQTKLELAEETLELARNRFNLGMLSLLELEQAIKDNYEATIEVSTRYYQRLLKQEELNLFLSETLLGEW